MLETGGSHHETPLALAASMTTVAPAAAPFVASFWSSWDAAVRECGDRPFLVFEADGGAVSDLSYTAMDRLVARVAGGLRARGVGSGDAVHLVLANSVAFVAVWLACAGLGAWSVPSDPRATPAELAVHIRRTRPRVGVCSRLRLGDYDDAIVLSAVQVDRISVDESDVSLDSLAGPTYHPSDPGGDARMAVMFTSGTTSAPKGVEVTQANYFFAGEVMAASAGLTRFDRQFVVLPLFHANAQYYSFASAIAVGASVALMGSFSASRFVEQARRHGATHASLFAAPIRMILARTPSGTAPLELRHAWFAQNLSSDQYRAISELLGCRPRQLYGMTETAPAVLVNPPVGSDPTTIGRPVLGCRVRVVDTDGMPVKPGQEGAIQVGGHPGSTLFAGYLDDPETTAAALVRDEGNNGLVWLDTGDRALVDGRGFHTFAGRRSDVLKVAGENVSVVEVEHVLGEHPAVGDVAVVGAPDDVRDEVPVAFVVVVDDRSEADHDAMEAELRRWADAQLSPSKRPRAYHFVDELPRTSVGKIRKFLLTAPPTPSVAGVPETTTEPDERTET